VVPSRPDAVFATIYKNCGFGSRFSLLGGFGAAAARARRSGIFTYTLEKPPPTFAPALRVPSL
jgi:hypothetical protein